MLAIDYRGYGDSSSVYPNEETLLVDAQSTYKWALDHLAQDPGTKIVVYGHSLGTGVTAKLIRALEGQSGSSKIGCVFFMAPI